MTEEEYLEALPVLAEWTPAMRARFVEGMAKLQATPITADDLADSIGVVAVSQDECLAYYMTRERALARGESTHWEEYQLEAIRTPPKSGSLKVLVAANLPEHTGFALIEVPIRVVIIGTASEAN